MSKVYAKDNAGTLQYPTASEFPGVPNWQTHDALLRRHGYMPLVGEAEPREGYNAVPATWHAVTQSETRIEPRQVLVPDIDPETGEKTGEHYEMQDTEVVYDTSYIQIDEWNYIEIPLPPPVVVVHEYSKLKLINACKEAGIWESVKADIQAMGKEDEFIAAQELKDDYPGFEQVVQFFKDKYRDVDVDAILEQSLIQN